MSGVAVFGQGRHQDVERHFQRASSGATETTGTAVSPPLPGDDLVFPLSYLRQMSNDLADGIFIPTITFSYNGYTLEGNAIQLSHAGCTSSTGSGVNTIAVPILVSGWLDLSTANGCSLVLSRAITGTGGTSAQGSGPVVLSGDSSYSGPTRTALAGGYLIVNGTLSGTSGVTVQASSSTSTLRGSGTLQRSADRGGSDSGRVRRGRARPARRHRHSQHRQPRPSVSTHPSSSGSTEPWWGAEYDQLHVDGRRRPRRHGDSRRRIARLRSQPGARRSRFSRTAEGPPSPARSSDSRKDPRS